jgi:hypothetical protein
MSAATISALTRIDPAAAAQTTAAVFDEELEMMAGIANDIANQTKDQRWVSIALALLGARRTVRAALKQTDAPGACICENASCNYCTGQGAEQPRDPRDQRFASLSSDQHFVSLMRAEARLALFRAGDFSPAHVSHNEAVAFGNYLAALGWSLVRNGVYRLGNEQIVYFRNDGKTWWTWEEEKDSDAKVYSITYTTDGI